MSIKEHIKFTLKMLNPTGTMCFIFGVIGIIRGATQSDMSLVILGVALILYASLLYEMNWQFDNLEGQVRNLNQRSKQ